MPTPLAARFLTVAKRYPPPRRGNPPKEALRGVDLGVEYGSIVGLRGPNRSGKTTLLKLLLSLGRPTRGSVIRLGRPASDLRTLSRIGYVREEPALPEHATAEGLLSYRAALTGCGADARKRIPELLRWVDLDDRRGEPLGRYSKGMLRRLALALAVVNEPDLLVLDEPGNGLDIEAAELVLDAARACRDRGGAVLLVSHDNAEIRRLCDRVIELDQGRITFDGTVDEWDAQGVEDRDFGAITELRPVVALLGHGRP